MTFIPLRNSINAPGTQLWMNLDRVDCIRPSGITHLHNFHTGADEWIYVVHAAGTDYVLALRNEDDLQKLLNL